MSLCHPDSHISFCRLASLGADEASAPTQITPLTEGLKSAIYVTPSGTIEVPFHKPRGGPSFAIFAKGWDFGCRP
jgi:hypothetical protein